MKTKAEPVFELSVPDGFSLTAPERKIVRSWFTNAEAPPADPWDDILGNGRHRLWGAWNANNKLRLPILSDLLLYEDSIDAMGEEFRQSVLLSSKIGGLKIKEDGPVRTRSKAYFEHLESNAAQVQESPDTALEIEIALMASGHRDIDLTEPERSES